MSILLATLSTLALAEEAPPIVNGRETSDYEAVGVLVSTNSQGQGYDFCSGTLVDEKWVITAAHCIEGMVDNERYGYKYHYFMIGTDVYDNNGVDDYAQIKNGYEHPNYNTNTLAHDIGLLELYTAIDSIDPIYVNKDGLGLSFKNKEITYVGWGITSDNAVNSSGVKRTVDVPVCTTGYCPSVGYTDDHLYTFDSTGGNICSGDSGGAALLDVDGTLLLAGANSFGFSNNGGAPNCVGSSAAAAATRVDTNLSWIEGYVSLPDVPSNTGGGGGDGGNNSGGGGDGGNNSGGSDGGSDNTGGNTGGNTSGNSDSDDDSIDWGEVMGCAAVPAAPGVGLFWLAGLMVIRRRR